MGVGGVGVGVMTGGAEEGGEAEEVCTFALFKGRTDRDQRTHRNPIITRSKSFRDSSKHTEYQGGEPCSYFVEEICHFP